MREVIALVDEMLPEDGLSPDTIRHMVAIQRILCKELGIPPQAIGDD
jgi:hypothetical protein